MQPTAPADLRNALALTPVLSRPGLYRGELDRSWSFLIPSGGVLMSLALAGMRMELARLGVDFVPAGATATFCSAVAEGALDVEVIVLRAGKTAAQLRANVRPRGQTAAPGDVGLEVVATWVQARPDEALASRAFVNAPDVPYNDAETYDAAQTGITRPPFYRNLEVRRGIGDVWWNKTWGPGDPHVARWYRYLVPPAWPPEGDRLDPLALPPIADTMASSVHQALGSRNPPLLFPSLDLTVHFAAPNSARADRPMLVDSHATALFEGTASARCEVWQGDVLLATATQTMTLRTIKGR